ncbi:hypothetical protein BBR47_45990 [Brevibacillus brevis NBRC 100599]|uniref:DUF4367 domain-containing protein n=1 Tax=Brevibacillus brevis (strain 47 / JCM 6285 / NBRC 100599) TaxID=358681 RepID=C0ZJK1_BREBN|nr:hypothetical protein [Brevibacillus brevis]BAH45576.1 hypothetical protein BBR47_45990 [Brevibacillus brevis NBRC 100599]
MKSKHNLDDFRELTDLLTDLELDDATPKVNIYNRLKFKLESGNIQLHEKDGIYMKMNKWKAATVSAVAVVCLLGAFSTTSFAQGMLQTILARFQVGNMEITQYDKELPATQSNTQGSNTPIELKEHPQMTLEEARAASKMDFPAPTWMPEHYSNYNTLIQAEGMVEVQYEKEEEFISFLISKGGENGINTTEGVKIETIGGKKVYFANGIVIWEHEGFTVELYHQKDLDTTTLGNIIKSFTIKK